MMLMCVQILKFQSMVDDTFSNEQSDSGILSNPAMFDNIQENLENFMDLLHFLFKLLKQMSMRTTSTSTARHSDTTEETVSRAS